MIEMIKRITYFEKSGPSNTEETINLAKERANELGIRDIVIASSAGVTAMKCAEVFDTSKFNLIDITLCDGWVRGENGTAMLQETREKLEAHGVKIFTGIHALSCDVGDSFIRSFKGVQINDVVRQTLYRFCEGMKVCVEIVLMAADAGLIPTNREVIAIAGTGRGADTAIVVKPSYPRKFLEFKINEIISKPREG